MTATYPGSVFPFTTKVDNTETIYAADINNIQNEVMAIESVVGLTPGTSVTTYANPTGSNPVYNPTAFTYPSLTARLANIEQGIVQDVHTQYVHRTGGDVITNSSASNVGLTVTGASGQTANLQNWTNSSGTVVASISANGSLYASAITSNDINNALVLGIFG